MVKLDIFREGKVYSTAQLQTPSLENGPASTGSWAMGEWMFILTA